MGITGQNDYQLSKEVGQEISNTEGVGKYNRETKVQYGDNSSSTITFSTFINEEATGVLLGQNYENVVLNQKSREESTWWVNSRRTTNGWSLKSKSQEIQITSNAFNNGWGAWTGTHKLECLDERGGRIAYKCQGFTTEVW